MSSISEGGVAVITGAAGGLGLGIAKAAALRGMSVVLSDIDVDRLDESVSALEAMGLSTSAKQADVSNPEGMIQLAESVVDEHGRVDLACLNAGISPVALPIGEIPREVWKRVLDINLYGVVNGIEAFLPLMEKQGSGHINATASVNGLMADPEIAPYNASKFAAVGVMESLHVELLRTGSPIEASVLCPGPIATDIIKRAIGDDRGKSAEEHDLLNRGMSPDEAGQITIDGIANGRFWIFTHELMISETLRTRFEEMAAAGARPGELDWPWDRILNSNG
ncbi:MAG: SDR family NAD(P)-dependent oxidoreductase [Acidimicrobiia bacterium]